MTQCEKILQHLTFNGSITAWEAIQEYGIMRLASRVTDLKYMGVPVKKVMETSKNRYGDPVSYARYYLEEEHDGTAS